MRRADERGLRYKAYANTTPRRCSSLDLERTNVARLRTPCNFPSTRSLRPNVTIPVIHWPPVRRLDARSGTRVQAGGGIDCQLHFSTGSGIMQCAVSRRILGNDLAPLPSGSFHGEFPDVGRPHEQADRSGGSRPVRIDQRPFRPHGKRCRGHAQPNEAAWQAQRREQRRGSISKSPAEGAFKQAAASHDRRQVARFRHGKRNLAAKFNLIGSEPNRRGRCFAYW